jgi:hypothetical protein
MSASSSFLVLSLFRHVMGITKQNPSIVSEVFPGATAKSCILDDWFLTGSMEQNLS